jgi:predicted DNA-binding mobile mystery protein A
MVTAHEQLDRRMAAMRPLIGTTRPARGWIRAIRNTLGMTTRQLGRRLGVSQPRVVKLEQSEIDGSITFGSLERAAEALGCRLVYAFVPVKPLTDTLEERASQIAERRLAAVDQTMRLEAQGVNDKKVQNQTRQRLIHDLLRHKARLWDEL